MLQPGKLLCEGKTKRVYETEDPKLAVLYFKDEAMAYQGLKRGRIYGKGEVNNAICRTLYTLLEKNGVPTHFVEPLDNRQSIIRRCEMIPLKVRVHNRVAGSLSQRMDMPVGQMLEPPVIEFLYKSYSLENPLVNISHIRAMKLATREEMDYISDVAEKVNDILKAYMREIGVELVDFKLEFGRCDGRIIVADEISPDNARFWDANTHEPMDIDRFKRDLGNAEQAYQELLQRMMGLEEEHE